MDVHSLARCLEIITVSLASSATVNDVITFMAVHRVEVHGLHPGLYH